MWGMVWISIIRTLMSAGRSEQHIESLCVTTASTIWRKHENGPQCGDGDLWSCRQGSDVNGRVKTKINKTDLSQKSFPTILRKSIPQTQKAAVKEKRVKAWSGRNKTEIRRRKEEKLYSKTRKMRDYLPLQTKKKIKNKELDIPHTGISYTA